MSARVGLSLLLATVALSGCAMAPSTGSHGPSAESAPQGAMNGQMEHVASVVQNASHGGLRVVSSFPGPAGMTGLVLGDAKGPKYVAWTIPSGDLVFIGGLYDAYGHEFSGDEAKTRLPATALAAVPQSPQPDPAASAAAQVAQPVPTGDAADSPENRELFFKGVQISYGFTQYAAGAKQTLYVFLDPNCGYCHLLYGTVVSHKDEFTKRGLSIKWIPVASFSSTSPGKAAALLKGGLPALDQNETSYNTAAEAGGIEEIQDNTLLDQVKQNTQLMQLDGIKSGTPTLVWKNASGVHVVVGAPSDAQLGTLLDMVVGSGGDGKNPG